MHYDCQVAALFAKLVEAGVGGGKLEWTPIHSLEGPNGVGTVGSVQLGM